MVQGWAEIKMHKKKQDKLGNGTRVGRKKKSRQRREGQAWKWYKGGSKEKSRQRRGESLEMVQGWAEIKMLKKKQEKPVNGTKVG